MLRRVETSWLATETSARALSVARTARDPLGLSATEGSTPPVLPQSACAASRRTERPSTRSSLDLESLRTVTLDLASAFRKGARVSPARSAAMTRKVESPPFACSPTTRRSSGPSCSTPSLRRTPFWGAYAHSSNTSRSFAWLRNTTSSAVVQRASDAIRRVRTSGRDCGPAGMMLSASTVNPDATGLAGGAADGTEERLHAAARAASHAYPRECLARCRKGRQTLSPRDAPRTETGNSSRHRLRQDAKPASGHPLRNSPVTTAAKSATAGPNEHHAKDDVRASLGV